MIDEKKPDILCVVFVLLYVTLNINLPEQYNHCYKLKINKILMGHRISNRPAILEDGCFKLTLSV